jgi:hypothetical protein
MKFWRRHLHITRPWLMKNLNRKAPRVPESSRFESHNERFYPAITSPQFQQILCREEAFKVNVAQVHTEHVGAVRF